MKWVSAHISWGMDTGSLLYTTHLLPWLLNIFSSIEKQQKYLYWETVQSLSQDKNAFPWSNISYSK